MSSLPAITGNRLIKILKNDGWIEGRGTRHGISLRKKFHDRTRVTIVKDSNESLPIGTLSAILSQKQTGLGRVGLLRLLRKK